MRAVEPGTWDGGSAKKQNRWWGVGSRSRAEARLAGCVSEGLGYGIIFHTQKLLIYIEVILIT
jgi:hypothetical protein